MIRLSPTSSTSRPTRKNRRKKEIRFHRLLSRLPPDLKVYLFTKIPDLLLVGLRVSKFFYENLHPLAYQKYSSWPLTDRELDPYFSHYPISHRIPDSYFHFLFDGPVRRCYADISDYSDLNRLRLSRYDAHGHYGISSGQLDLKSLYRLYEKRRLLTTYNPNYAMEMVSREIEKMVCEISGRDPREILSIYIYFHLSLHLMGYQVPFLEGAEIYLEEVPLGRCLNEFHSGIVPGISRVRPESQSKLDEIINSIYYLSELCKGRIWTK